MWLWLLIRCVWITDSSGMDFRAMLKKRKYAKWGKEKEPEFPDLKETEKPAPTLRKVEKVCETWILCIRWQGVNDSGDVQFNLIICR